MAATEVTGRGPALPGRLARSLRGAALVTELTISKPSQKLRLDEGDITDDWRCAENIPHRAQSPSRVAFREADHRAGIAELTGPNSAVGRRATWP